MTELFINYKYQRKLFHYETDADGVCHASNYLRLFEESMESFFDSKGIILSNQLVISHSDIHYIKSIRTKSVFSININKIYLYRAYMIFDVEIHNLNEEKLTRMKIKLVEVSRDSQVPMPISSHIKNKLTKD